MNSLDAGGLRVDEYELLAADGNSPSVDQNNHSLETGCQIGATLQGPQYLQSYPLIATPKTKPPQPPRESLLQSSHHRLHFLDKPTLARC